MRVEFCGIKIELLYITINFRYIHNLNKDHCNYEKSNIDYTKKDCILCFTELKNLYGSL